MTFNSFRVFRHMTHLLFVAGDPELAKRTLRLYVQVVSKAREAMSGESDIDLTLICDTDRNWVTTLIHGARMLCRLALQESDYGTALEEAKEAGVMIEKAKTRLDNDDMELVAGVQLAEAIWCGVMALTGRFEFVPSASSLTMKFLGRARPVNPGRTITKLVNPITVCCGDFSFSIHPSSPRSCSLSTWRSSRHERSDHPCSFGC